MNAARTCVQNPAHDVDWSSSKKLGRRAHHERTARETETWEQDTRSARARVGEGTVLHAE